MSHNPMWWCCDAPYGEHEAKCPNARRKEVEAVSQDIRNAKWEERPENPATKRPAWKGYKVRNRGGASVYSREGFFWFNSWGSTMPRPSESIRFHGGPLDGQVLTRAANT